MSLPKAGSWAPGNSELMLAEENRSVVQGDRRSRQQRTKRAVVKLGMVLQALQSFGEDAHLANTMLCISYVLRSPGSRVASIYVQSHHGLVSF